MIKKVVDTVLEIGVRAIKGSADADAQLQVDRLSICMKCPMLQTYNENKFSCGTFFLPTLIGENKTCGCDVNYKVKYKNEECPQGKWLKH